MSIENSAAFHYLSINKRNFIWHGDDGDDIQAGQSLVSAKGVGWSGYCRHGQIWQGLAFAMALIAMERPRPPMGGLLPCNKVDGSLPGFYYHHLRKWAEGFILAR